MDIFPVLFFSFLRRKSLAGEFMGSPIEFRRRLFGLPLAGRRIGAAVASKPNGQGPRPATDSDIVTVETMENQFRS